MAKTRVAPNEHIGKNIAALMRATPALDTQKKLEAKTKIPQSTIGRIIRGDVSTSAEYLQRIASALEVQVTALHLDHETFLRLLEDGTLKATRHGAVLNAVMAPLTGLLVAGPAIPPGTPMTTRTITEEQWQLLQDIDMLIEEDREAIRKTIKEKADYARRVFDEMVRRATNSGSGNS